MANSLYCDRCRKHSQRASSIQQHYNDSISHNRCPVCPFDSKTWDKLLKHHQSTLHRTVCMGCDKGNGIIWDPESKEYQDHLKEENVCEQCGQHFESPSNLKNHKFVYMPRSLECYGCYKTYKTFPYIILHLESGYCSLGIDTLDLNKTAVKCY
ncbi:uncharacterized protein BDZ99DRAFT_247045 [Mytilinidion resinicola]|uniref:C2H2-type domain-containing protein n=1 Tax=Mytilinidion resinicola TaxID=574789 RepID=A0A6A6YWN9_9PEZI|nr:uncharacterized protein BDZ99DRAFT_247045 [Mytilinidion resinicola]KAF2812978.1 hypothetical protein BDZ99DRAFT_247045 [Mytilinidion resinicola]